jgi:hypothetical protein
MNADKELLTLEPLKRGRWDGILLPVWNDHDVASLLPQAEEFQTNFVARDLL